MFFTARARGCVPLALAHLFAQPRIKVNAGGKNRFVQNLSASENQDEAFITRAFTEGRVWKNSYAKPKTDAFCMPLAFFFCYVGLF